MDSCQSPVNIMRDMDSKMVKFFHSVLRYELKVGRAYADAVEEVINAYSKETISSGNSHICFSSPVTRCAYVFRCCACIATTAAYHFLQLLKNNTMLFQKINFSDSFHLCCLGGGPGTEIAAIAKILDGLMRNCCPTRRKPLLIKATIIDIDSGWLVTAQNLIKTLSQLVDTSLIHCELNFIETNLSEPLRKHVTDAIGEADFVTMIRFLSAVHGSKYKNRSDQMLQEIISHIKEDGTLFFMDSSSNIHFEAFRRAMELFPDMTETYGPLARDLYKMSVFSVADSIKLNKKYFGLWLPPIMAVNYVSAWSKGGNQNPTKSPTVVGHTEDDVESRQREEEKHLSKCLKFCSPRAKVKNNNVLECTFEDKGMFSTKSKKKRIERTLEI